MKKMKYILIILSVVCLFCSCVQQGAIMNSEPAVDLSAYEKHGNWSCGRIWVQKTDSTWDSSQTVCGYLDEKGQLVGRWHSIDEWKYPMDYVNNYALVGIEAKFYAANLKPIIAMEVIDYNGNTIASLDVHSHYNGNMNYYKSGDITQFNTYGYAFCETAVHEDTYVRSSGYCMIGPDGKVTKLDSQMDIYSLDDFQGYFSEGYMYYSNKYYFNTSGKLMLDFSDGLERYFGQKYSIITLYPIEDGLAKVVFEGKDGKKYFIVVDLYGNLLTEQPISYEQFSDYDFAAVNRADNSRLSSLKKNDIKDGAVVKFGNYEQDNIRANGSELIEWLVLKTDRKKALLVSKYVLDACEYAANLEYSKEAEWSNSSIRQWLNYVFYPAAFGEDESDCILSTSIDTKVITYTGVYNNKKMQEDIESRDVNVTSTTDKVFLLSVDEIKSLMSVDEIMGFATEYAAEKIHPVKYFEDNYSKSYYQWMTRDLLAHKSYDGIYTKQVFSFEGRGNSIFNYEQWDSNYRYDIDGVRPAIYIDLEKLN